MTFVVRNTTGSEVSIDDLGQKILAAEEFDLLLSFAIEDLTESADLTTLLNAGTLERLTGFGGSVIPPANAFDDAVPAHTHTSVDVTDFQAQVSSNTTVSANAAHVGATGNPHFVTAAQVGAAAISHGHVAADVSDFQATVSTNAIVVANAAHVLLTSNPHSVTAAQVGAALAVHTHTVSQISDFAAGVAANETLTSLALSGTTLNYTDEAGTVNPVDLSGLGGGGGSVFGSDHADAERTSTASTTGTADVTYQTLNVTATAAGRYRVGWFFVYHKSSASQDIDMKVQVNGNNIIDPADTGQLRVEPKDPGTDQRIAASGFAYLNLAAGAHTITQLFNDNGSGTSFVHHGVLEFWRVS